MTMFLGSGVRARTSWYLMVVLKIFWMNIMKPTEPFPGIVRMRI